jgi:hypothetical protein
MGSQRATELYNQLRAAVAQPDVNHQHARSLLAQLKVRACGPYFVQTRDMY